MTNTIEIGKNDIFWIIVEVSVDSFLIFLIIKMEKDYLLNQDIALEEVFHFRATPFVWLHEKSNNTKAWITFKTFLVEVQSIENVKEYLIGFVAHWYKWRINILSQLFICRQVVVRDNVAFIINKFRNLIANWIFHWCYNFRSTLKGLVWLHSLLQSSKTERDPPNSSFE